MEAVVVVMVACWVKGEVQDGQETIQVSKPCKKLSSASPMLAT